MKTRRGFLKTAALSGLGVAAGARAFSYSRDEKELLSHPVEDLTKNLPDFTREDFLARQDKARERMDQMGIHALFVEGGANLLYFMNINWWLSERVFGCLLSPHAETVWICPAFEKARAEEVIAFGNDIRVWEEHTNPYGLFKDYLKSIGRQGGKIGIDPNARSFVNEGMRKAGGFRVVDGAVVTEPVRAVKSEKEIEIMDTANRITKLAYKKGFSQLREGMTTGELGQIIRQAHTDLGASGGGGPMFGFTAAFPHGTRQVRNLQEGDVVLVDGGCSVKGYKSDVTRTVVFGKPSDELKKAGDTVRNAQQAAFRAIKDGAVCGDADQAARREMEKGGFGSGYEYFAHRLGHGIGMETHEYPYLVKDNPLKMSAGMTFTNEPGLYLYGKFGVRIEDSLAVTGNGCKILGGMPCVSMDDVLSETI
ncbi:MAG: Xaa-Pro peptidase family protein [Bacteroidota bacterium]